MNKRLLSGVLLVVVGCSGDENSGDGTGGSAGASGTAGLSGGGTSSSGGAGQGMGGSQGTGATATGAQPGKGGSAPGTGGSSAGGSGTGGTAGSAAGGASAGGAAGTGTGGMGMAGAPPVGDYSVLERNKHANRDGAFVEPKLTAAVAATLVKTPTFNGTFTGSMWASPLYMTNGPANKGVFFAVTTGNDVFALDETTGAQVWKKNIGSSPTANGVACGNIHPLGILSTPVIDAASRTIYVAGAIGTSSISSHQVHALSVDDGTEKPGYPITISGTSGGTTFTPPPQNQRSALSLVNGILYVAYGGHVGDCGDYHGWVFGIDTKDPTKKGGWATLGRGEAIWAAGGLASDGNGVFAVTGNNTARVSDHMMSDSEEVVRITGLGVLDRSNKNLYFPANWNAMDGQDWDFGASNPMYLALPGSTPDHVVVAISKNGQLYLLDPANLGGMGGHLATFRIASDGMSIKTAPASFTDAKGVHVLLSTDGGAACPAGGASGRVVMSVLLAPGSPPKPAVEWCASQGGAVAGPISTTTDGKTDPIVWYMSSGTLKGVNGVNGMSVFSSKETCSGVKQWTSPIAVGGRIVVGGDGHLCSWSTP